MTTTTATATPSDHSSAARRCRACGEDPHTPSGCPACDDDPPLVGPGRHIHCPACLRPICGDCMAALLEGVASALRGSSTGTAEQVAAAEPLGADLMAVVRSSLGAMIIGRDVESLRAVSRPSPGRETEYAAAWCRIMEALGVPASLVPAILADRSDAA